MTNHPHSTYSPLQPQHPRSQKPDHPREHSRDRPREPHPTSHPPTSTVRAVAPAVPDSEPVVASSVPAPGSINASAPQAEIRTAKAEQTTPRRSTALVDERPAKIKIAQQPLHARMCGFGEKDRRPVDPPPIVQLLLDEDHEQHPTKRMQRSAAAAASKKAATLAIKSKDKDNGDKEGDKVNTKSNQLDDTTESPSLGKRSRPSSSSDNSSKNKTKQDDNDNDSDSNSGGSDDELDDDDEGQLQEQDPLFVLHVSLWSADGTEVRNMIATPGQTEPPKLTRILMGSLVVSPILLNNPEGVPGWYFSFPDLSIRTEGVYTLKFSLMRFGSFDFTSSDDGHASMLVAEETSEPFTVFSAKKFPGMTESTELSKAFAKQGLKIPIRNDLRVRKADRDN
ncbi:hypothetical protein BGZ76_004613 [Entomortierella beljakovae]|nr:hypothetical protein BGZ76_004613 [Entomortierella beljakovae]